MSTAKNIDPDDPMAGYYAWLAREAELKAALAKLEQTLAADETALQQLYDDQSYWGKMADEIEMEIDEMEEQGYSPSYMILDKLKNARDKANADQPLIDAARSKVDADNQAISDYKAKFGDFLSDSTTTTSANLDNKVQLDQLVSKEEAQSNRAALDATRKKTIEDQAKDSKEEALNSVVADIMLDIDMGEDAVARINNITADKIKVNNLNDDIDADKRRIQKDIIEIAILIAAIPIFGAIAAAPFIKDLHEASNKLQSDRTARDAAQADIGTQTTALNKDLDALAKIDIDGLNNLISSLFDTIGKLVSLIGKDGKVSEGNMQQASVLIAEVMTIIEMITAKVHQLRSADQQWMSRANASTSEVASAKAESTYKHIDELAAFASFMKAVMQGIEIASIALSGAMAIASGGALAIVMFGLMTALAASGAFNKMTEALANKMSSSGATWAKVLADVVIAIAMVLATHTAAGLTSGFSSTARQAITEAASEVESEVEIEMADLAQNAANAVDDDVEEAEQEVNQAVENEINEVAAGGKNEVEQNVAKVEQKANQVIENEINQNLDNGAVANEKSFVRRGFERSFQTMKENFTWKTNLGMGTTYFGATNGVVDAAEFSYAAATKRANATEDEMSKEQVFQILKIVASILQALIMMVGAKYGAGNSGESAANGLAKNAPNLMLGLQFLQYLAMVGNVEVNVELFFNSQAKGQLMTRLGEAQSDIDYTKALGQVAKLYEKKEIELFASKLEQQIDALHMMIKKNGEAEMEAAKVLEQSAV